MVLVFLFLLGVEILLVCCSYSEVKFVAVHAECFQNHFHHVLLVRLQS